MICLSKTFWKLQKLIPSKKDQSVLIAEIRSLETKTKNANIHKSKLSQKILCYMIVLYFWYISYNFFFEITWTLLIVI